MCKAKHYDYIQSDLPAGLTMTNSQWGAITVTGVFVTRCKCRYGSNCLVTIDCLPKDKTWPPIELTSIVPVERLVWAINQPNLPSLFHPFLMLGNKWDSTWDGPGIELGIVDANGARIYPLNKV